MVLLVAKHKMRIIAGEWKGRRLKTVKGMNTRPTSDKVKGAIFNILGPRTIEAQILDLYAGTGNLSFEALSRGATGAVLVERSPAAWETIKENAKLLGAEERTRVLKMDALTFLEQKGIGKFDLIFLDPPYRRGIAQKMLMEIRDRAYLNPQGVIIAETAADEVIPGDLYPLEVMITKEYGDTKIWFLQASIE